MTLPAEPLADRPTEADSAKRRQIIQGATSVFLAKGFDAASMGEIARIAGVSKGTLYVYFESKEELFDAIVNDACELQAERVFEFGLEDHDVESVLTRLGISFASVMSRPERLSAIRTVIAIAERMPEQGRRFYETGPAVGIANLKSYLEAQNAAGVLKVDDCEVVAAQFIDAVSALTFRPMLFNFDAPSPERIAYVVKIAVRAFLAAYKAR